MKPVNGSANHQMPQAVPAALQSQEKLLTVHRQIPSNPKQCIRPFSPSTPPLTEFRSLLLPCSCCCYSCMHLCQILANELKAGFCLLRCHCFSPSMATAVSVSRAFMSALSLISHASEIIILSDTLSRLTSQKHIRNPICSELMPCPFPSCNRLSSRILMDQFL